MNYYARHENYMSLCAARGNRNMKTEDVTKYCSQAGTVRCVPMSGKRYSTNCIRDEAKGGFSYADICNGDKFTFLVTTGEWSYRGFNGSVKSAPDDGGKDGDCIVICHK